MNTKWSDQAERRFSELVNQELQGSARLMNLLAVVFFPLFSLLDLFTQPAHFKELSVIRFSASGIYLVFYLNRNMIHNLKNPFFYSMILLSIGSLSVTLMCVVMDGYLSTYYAGVNLVMLTAVMLFPWGARRMVIAVSIIMGIYFLGVLIHARFSIEQLDVFINNAYFMVTTAVIGVISSYFIDRLRRESFLRFLRIEEAQTDLKKQDEIKTKFFANVSHELRTPATLILGPVRKLLQAQVEHERQDLEMIERNARLLLSHINDLLDVARLEAGKTEIRYARVNVAQLARRLASHFELLAQEKEIDWKVEAPEAFSAEIDLEKIERILMNLLSNAFKFTPVKGKILFRLSGGTDETLTFSVQDSGPGIPPELKEIIFERFYQIEQSLTRKHSGTGLGLSIVKEFVTLHQGEIQVLEVPGGGAEFKVILPVHAPENTPVSESYHEGRLSEDTQAVWLDSKVSMPVQSVSKNPNQPLVLIVEDNVDMNAYVSSLLSNRFRIANAFDGKEGIEKALTLQPDLILSDLMMPGYSGVDLLRALRSNPLLDFIPILFLTAKADDELRISLLQNGAQDYIIKPFVVEELIARVTNWAGLSRSKKILRENLGDLPRSVLDDNIEILAQEVAEKKQQLQQALGIVQAARDQAENAVRLREEFLSIASHELKTPVTAMKLQTELFKRKVISLTLTDEGTQFVSKQIVTFESQLNRLGRLIEEMLDFSVIQSGRLVLRKEETDLVLLLNHAIEQMRDPKNARLNVKGVPISIQGESSLVGLWDPLKLEQVILNLLSNAEKYGDGKPIEIQLTRANGNACFQVTDHGIGISREKQNKIFNRFERAVSARNFGGLGLGLYIAKQIVESHGGEITVESEPAKGSTFTVTLPVS